MTAVEVDRSSEDPEVQTPKAARKELPCIGCKRRLIVSVFYAPQWARCKQCKKEGVEGLSGPIEAITGVQVDQDLVEAEAARSGLAQEVVSAFLAAGLPIPDRHAVDAVGYSTKQINAILAGRT